MVSQTRQQIVAQFVEQHMHVIIDELSKYLTQTVSECSFNIQQKIIIKMCQIVDTYTKKTIEHINTNILDPIEKNPYNSGENFISDSHTKHVIATLINLLHQHKNIDFVKMHNETPDKLVVIINNTMNKNVDVYIEKAKEIVNYTTHLWYSKCEFIHTSLIEHIGVIDEQIEEAINKEIQLINEDDLSEPDGLQLKRDNLMAIQRICYDLLTT
jgi:hypothetical protein